MNFGKMREFLRIALVCLCGFLLVRDGLCLDVDGSAEVTPQEARNEEQSDSKKEVKASSLPGTVRRSTVQSSSNATRDSQLLSLLANRRRQLLSGRLAAHINTLTTLAHKTHKGNTTFAQLEVRDANSSLVRRITFENSSNEISPSLKLITTDGSKEIKQDIKPHEIKNLFIPKIYQENRSRAGFINNRKKNTIAVPETTTDSIIYVPPEHFDQGVEKAIDLEPEEEFQVDESNHGLYLLNYSDADNITQSPYMNVTHNDVQENITKVENTTQFLQPPLNATTSKTTVMDAPKDEKIETNIIANSTLTVNNPTVRNDNEKDKGNQTLFMSDEIYNHFRPLESELPVEDMAPFLYFGQKIGGQIIGDNLTNSPSLSASTKSVNFIIAPPDKRRFNSRYSATEKYRNTSIEEEEVNEDMDVSVVKNVIEKNKIRNTVKGPAPTRNVGLVNAYRKHPSTQQTTPNPLSFSQLNVTEPIVQNVSPATIDRGKENNYTKNDSSTIKNQIHKTNSNPDINVTSTTIVKDNIIKTNITNAPRNFTRNYLNLRRRPAKLTSASTENSLVIPTVVIVNTTTEKASTVYTAVVTSVSITSSMKGQNKTDGLSKEDNNTLSYVTENKNMTSTIKPVLLNDTEIPIVKTSINKPYKHRIRIRTTTTESTLNPVPSSAPLTNETVSRLSQRLANLFKQNNTEEESFINGSTIRPKNILKRRRPTTTTSTTTTTVAPVILTEPIANAAIPIELHSSLFPTTTTSIETTEKTEKPIFITSRTASESYSQPVLIPLNKNNTLLNATKTFKEDSQNEEVVIEAEKTYTASYILAGLGLFPIAAVIVFVFRNVMNKKTKEIETEYEGYFEDADVKKESPITPVARAPLPTPAKPDQKWEFPRNKLRLQTLLGQGNFGQVWKAEADDLNGHDGLTRLVAVKTIKESASQKEKQELLHEIYIMQKIGTHPNVVTILACCTEQEPYLLIMEYVMCGKMLTYLRERRSRPDRFSGSGTLTSRDLTVFAYCVARGMEYIASKGIVHRDLAARNVLVDHNKLCKIADFGMSRCAGAGARGARGALPVRWMAPEALLYNVYTHQTDVWAFGILLWEIVTLGSTPYAAMSGREVLTAVTEGYRLERPPHCKPQLYRAMHSCWHADPSQRPTFMTLKSQLAELLDNEPSEGNYVDLDSFYQESSVYSDPSAIIHDDDGLSAEYDRERRVFRELERTAGPVKFENRVFNFRDEELRNKFGIGTARMGGFGIRDVPFNDRNFSDGEFNERTFPEGNFTERNFTDKNFNDPNFTERKDGKLSTSSFHRERERENPLVSRNSFNGFPRIATRDNHFQINNDRNKRVSEFECDI